uniref:PNPLA domain-containing protein n=1 Tax=Globisporangium ultimum (strain ATCC 200006 / CBS 805.95 / DAOM BR144) TaxID=431595 RepID=K3WWS4_GLOUD
MTMTLAMQSTRAEELSVLMSSSDCDDRSKTLDSMSTDTEESDDDQMELDAPDVTMCLETMPLARNERPSLVELAFSASGGLFTYQMGVAAYIQDHFDLSNCHFSGCSGGSWAATLLAAETNVHDAWKVILATQKRLIPANYSWYSGYGRYATIVSETIQELWKDDLDVFKRVENKNLHIAVTKFPSMKGENHNSWTSLDDLMKSIMASALVPFALSGRPYIVHRGQKYIDGCVSNFKGVNLSGSEYTTASEITYHVKKLAVDTMRSSMTTLASYLLPSSLQKPVASFIYRALPNVSVPHAVIAPLSLAVAPANNTSMELTTETAPSSSSSSSSETKDVHRLLIQPWTWRGQSLTSYHLTVDIDTHQERFDTGYQDAMANYHEFAAVLRPLTQ